MFEDLVRVRSGVHFVRAILLEQHAEQLICRDRNDQKSAASHANHKCPAHDMSKTRNQEIEHIHAPVRFDGILQERTGI